MIFIFRPASDRLTTVAIVAKSREEAFDRLRRLAKHPYQWVLVVQKEMAL